jgi:hypothetical protein
MGWTLKRARAQPFADLVLLAADNMMQAEAVERPTPSASPPSSGRKVVARTVRYEAA